MLVYRIVNLKYKESALSGAGAEKVGGRWNAIGTRAVYCSENISLALLEYYVHSENIAYLPSKIALARIQIPDTFPIVELDELPENWDSYPYSIETTKVFTEFAKDRNNFALKVPSTIVPLEFNYILNPLYKNLGKVEVLECLDLSLDESLNK